MKKFWKLTIEPNIEFRYYNNKITDELVSIYY